MSSTKLDDIDRKILSTLQDHGRMTNVDLAERVGITAPPCLRRVRSLEKAGFIEGYHAELNADKLGFGITVFAMVSLRSQKDADLKAFEARVQSWPLVREAYLLNGEIDYILKIIARDLAEYKSFLTEQITAAEEVEHVNTALMINATKAKPIVPPEMLEGKGPSAANS